MIELEWLMNLINVEWLEISEFGPWLEQSFNRFNFSLINRTSDSKNQFSLGVGEFKLK